ncbi:hypothetical protein LRP31_33200 (plasmid) [Mesorhizobium mediterraneum]|uniref:hypothetical protein n=1 Tax=Mesorhizobium mediterraneum TaxID=43617 RepID=UPI001FDA74A4|nr:hypothetical protein [Mesorhizobium mediterraneum]WIW57005.1 hypothetical protein LRP31_33200 [Mesorhizobium mediterraneum]
MTRISVTRLEGHRQHHQTHDQRRDRHQEVDGARQDRIEPAAKYRRREAQDGAEREGQRGGEHGDEQRDAGAIDHAGQQIAAEIVGAQPIGRRHRLPHIADDLGIAVRRDQRRKHGQQHKHGRQHQADQRRDGDASGIEHIGRHYLGRLSRGLATIAAMSAMILRLI